MGRQTVHLLGIIGLLFPVACIGSSFDFQTVVDKAKKLAKQPYEAPSQIPAFMRDLDYNTYRAINFKPEHSLWHESNTNFQVMLVPPGRLYEHTVRLNVIDAQGARRVPFDKRHFEFPDAKLKKRIPPDLGYSGFKLTYPLDQEGNRNQFLVFAGASYYRAVGRENHFGLSGRGLTIDTGLPKGEEFPDFVEFWLQRPSPDAERIRLYGLLDGANVTGAYRFTVIPGETTTLRVKSTLFPRGAIEQMGIAPLTSMFYYGGKTPKPAGEWRPEVHDSDGLLIHNGESNEWLWRPLQNPETLSMDYFETQDVAGYGLLQRDQSVDSYMDPEARYEARPSAWVEPQDSWGPGQVVLVQIPTPNETNDNVVAFWKPEKPVTQKDGPMTFNYSVHYGDSGIPDEPMARVVDTFVGDGSRIGGGDQAGAARVIVDFKGGPLAELTPDASVTGSVSMLNGGELLGHYVEYLPMLERWRLSILARPKSGKPLSMRAFLKQEADTLSETWSFKLPSDNAAIKGTD